MDSQARAALSMIPAPVPFSGTDIGLINAKGKINNYTSLLKGKVAVFLSFSSLNSVSLMLS